MNNLENNKLSGLYYIKLLIIILFLLICLSFINNNLIIKNNNENYYNYDRDYVNKSAILNIFKKDSGDNYKLIGLDSGDKKFGIYGVEIQTYFTNFEDTLIGSKTQLSDDNKFKLYELNEQSYNIDIPVIQDIRDRNLNIQLNIPFLVNINGFELHTNNYTPSRENIDFKGLNLEQEWISLLNNYNTVETTSTSIIIKNINTDNNSFINYKIQIKNIGQSQSNIELNNIVLYSRFNNITQPSLI